MTIWEPVGRVQWTSVKVPPRSMAKWNLPSPVLKEAGEVEVVVEEVGSTGRFSDDMLMVVGRDGCCAGMIKNASAQLPLKRNVEDITSQSDAGRTPILMRHPRRSKMRVYHNEDSYLRTFESRHEIEMCPKIG